MPVNPMVGITDFEDHLRRGCTGNSAVPFLCLLLLCRIRLAAIIDPGVNIAHAIHDARANLHEGGPRPIDAPLGKGCFGHTEKLGGIFRFQQGSCGHISRASSIDR